MYPKDLKEKILERCVEDKETGCLEWQGCKNNTGYGGLSWKGKTYLTHRVMCDAPKDVCALHRCDNPVCCNPDPLFLGTHADNSKDMITKGRFPDRSGIKNPRAKLDEADVLAIRGLLSEGVTQQQVSYIYNISPIQVSRISQGKTWRHLLC